MPSQQDPVLKRARLRLEEAKAAESLAQLDYEIADEAAKKVRYGAASGVGYFGGPSKKEREAEATLEAARKYLFLTSQRRAAAERHLDALAALSDSGEEGIGGDG